MAKRQLPDQILEQHITALICFNDEQAVALVAELPDDYYCTNPALTAILKKVRPYVKQQNRAPGELLPDLMFREIDRGDATGQLVQQEIRNLAECMSRIDTALVRSDVATYLRSRHVEQACAQAMQEALNDPDEALELLNRSISQAVTGEAGLREINMLDTEGFFARRREQLEERNQFRFPVSCFEEQWIAPKRGRVMTFAGPTHGGKSHLQRETVFINLRYHHCMHIYCEHGDDPETEYRMLAYGFTKHPGDRQNRRALTTITIPHLDVLDGKLTASYTTRQTECIDNQEAYIALHEVETFSNLHLYRASPLTLTFVMVRREIERLRTLGVIIDMLAVDYPSKMKIDSKREMRLEEARLAMEFSQLCADYNIAGLSISQLNAEGNKAKRPSIYNLNESIDKAFIGDDILLLTADEDAKRAQVVYLIAGKTKGEEHGQTAALATCLKIGRICLDDVIISDSEVNEISILAEGSVDAQILDHLRANPTSTNVAVAAQFNVPADRVDRIAHSFLSAAERAQRPGRGRPRTHQGGVQ